MDHTRIAQLRRRPARSLAAAVFVSALALAACGGGASPGPTEDAVAPPQTTTATTTPSSDDTATTGQGTVPAEDTRSSPPPALEPANLPTQPLGGPDTLRKENWGVTGADLNVAGIRIGQHDTFDRVVFDLAGTGEPGWIVEYNAAPAEQGSGFPIEYHGNVALTVNLLGMNTPLRVGGMPGVGGVVNEVLPDKNHHGTSQFVIGLDQETPFSVTLLREPNRLVIDILHEAAPPVARPLGNLTWEPKRQEASTPPQQLITGVRFAGHDDFDRVVFDLVGEGSPGWMTDFNDAPVQAASGLPVEYDGATALEVTLTGITPIAEDGTQQPDLGVTPGAGGVITEVISAVIFEGHSQFVIGLENAAPYSVSLLEDPQRVVVDVMHE